MRHLLVDATRLRLRADVAVGAYLSGGLDSSVVAALARSFSTNTLRTFSVAFADHEYDERTHQEQIARLLGTEHHAIDEFCWGTTSSRRPECAPFGRGEVRAVLADAGSEALDRLLKSGIIDSTGVLDLLLFVEDTFRIHVEDEDLTPENFDSIDNLTRYIEARLVVHV